jgi:CRP-like cAMP-binding protein
LNSDRAQLIQAFLDSLTAVFGKATFAPIARTLQMQPDSDEAQTMLSLLGEMTTSETARKLHLLLTRSKNDDLYVTSDIAHRAKNPAETIQDLLRQEDEWRPLLVLYALSALPRVLFQVLVPDELVETILEKSRQSNQDTIRESARLIRQALKEDFAASRADSALSRISPTDKDSNAMLSTIERMLFLRNVSFFENLRLDQLRTLARICDELAVNQGDYILHKGEAGDSLFVVVEGRIKIVDPGSENVLAVLSSGEVLGEISLFDGGVRSADAFAETTTLLLVVNRDALDDALADDPGIALDMLRVMALRIRESNKTLSRMSQKMNVSEIRQELQEIRKEMNEI